MTTSKTNMNQLFISCIIYFCLLIPSISTPIPLPADPDDPIDLPDPCSVYHNGMYYQYGGQYVISSIDMINWSPMKHYYQDLPSWSNGYPPGAPSLYKFSENQWNIYYQTEHKKCNNPSNCPCIAVSIASTPTGPFKALDIDPIICQEQYDYAIDACVRNISSQLVMYWKTNGPDAQRLWVANLTTNGTALASEPIELMYSNLTNWENGIIEGPSMIYWKHKWRLMYSGNDCMTQNYSIGYGNCETPWGPCEKQNIDKPWLTSYNKTRGPGGQEQWVDLNGNVWLIFHGWEEGHVGYNHGGMRSPRTYPLTYLESVFGELV
eukprot:394264_1